MPEQLPDQSNNYDSKSDDSDSFIRKTLDIFLFGPLLSVLPKKYITRQFISGFLLSVFLAYLYFRLGILSIDVSAHMLALYVIILLTLVEVTRKNIPILNAYLSNDRQSMLFFKNLESMTHDQMYRFVKFHIFSSKCLNRMLIIVKEDKNKIPSDILEYALTTQDLTKENLDLLFSREIDIDEDIVKAVLFQKSNQLTEQNITNIFEKFKENPRVIKVLFATQKSSKKLIDHNQNIEFLPYFEKFQTKSLHLDNWLKKIPASWSYICNGGRVTMNISLILSVMIAIVISHLFVSSVTKCVGFACIFTPQFIGFLFPIWMSIFFILIFSGIPGFFTKSLRKNYINHFLSRVESVEV